MPKAEHNPQDGPPVVDGPVEARIVDVTRMTDDNAAGEDAAGQSPFDDTPFERGFPPAGGAELTNSYIPALERAIEEDRRRSARP